MRGDQRSEARTQPDGGSVFPCFGFSVKGRRYTADGMRHAVGGRGRGGFSLVEVTVAIGIFAFVVVGILGLLPTALKQRADSALETRAVMIANELFSSVEASPNITNVRVRVGASVTESDVRYNQNLLNTSVVLGYAAGTTLPFWFFESPGSAWTNAGGQDPQIRNAMSRNEVDMLALLTANPVPNSPNLFKLTVEVRSPAAAAITNSTTTEFTTLYYQP